MGFWSKVVGHWTKPKNPDSVRFRREMAERIAGQYIKYVTERINNVDEVIGRRGSLAIRDDEFLVFASADILFRCKIDELRASELLSKDGVVLIGPDLEHGGEERTIIAYYVYYRK